MYDCEPTVRELFPRLFPGKDGALVSVQEAMSFIRMPSETAWHCLAGFPFHAQQRNPLTCAVVRMGCTHLLCMHKDWNK